MDRLRPAQRKALSEFFNTIAAAWFTAGVISPLFLQQTTLLRHILLGTVSLSLTVVFLGWSLVLVRRIRL